MTAPVFGDLAAVNRYIVDLEREYELYEIAEQHDCPADVRSEYWKAGSDIAMIDHPSDPALPGLWKAMEFAEKRVRAWGTANGFKVSKYGMRDEDGGHL